MLFDFSYLDLQHNKNIVKVEGFPLFKFYDMPPLFLLFVISVASGSNYARNDGQTNFPAPQITAVSVAKTEVAIPVVLSDADAATPPAIAIIEAEVAGLLMPSETDAPILVKYWASEQTELLFADVAALVEQKADAPVETQTVAAFFKNAATIEAWMDDEGKVSALKFQKLSETLQTQLENPQVYLFGERERTVVVIGKVKGGFGGVVTLVVET